MQIYSKLAETYRWIFVLKETFFVKTPKLLITVMRKNGINYTLKRAKNTCIKEFKTVRESYKSVTI